MIDARLNLLSKPEKDNQAQKAYVPMHNERYGSYGFVGSNDWTNVSAVELKKTPVTSDTLSTATIGTSTPQSTAFCVSLIQIYLNLILT